MTLIQYKNSTGKTYRQLAEETKVPLATVFRACQGKQSNANTISKLHETTKLPLSELISGRAKL